MPRLLSRMAAVAAAAAVAVVLAGCGLQIPVDPDGTLDRIDGGELRAGASPAGRLVEVSKGDVEGPLADLVEDFAHERGAHVTWVIGSEELLVDAIEAGELDVAIGGMTDATPWSERVSVTRGYPGIPGADGAPVVVLLPLGENALQVALEAYLDERVGG